FLDADDIGKSCQTFNRLREYIRPCPPRDVVEDQRDLHGLGYSRKVPIVALLCRFVVVGSDEKSGVGAGALGKAGQAKGLARAVGSRTGHNLDAAASHFNYGSDDLLMFRMVNGWGLPRGPDG